MGYELMDDRPAPGLNEATSSAIVSVVLLLLVLFGLLAPRRGYTIEARAFGGGVESALAGVGLVGWLGGLLTPGGANALGALRPWLTGVAFTSLVLHMIMANIGGETSSILLQIAAHSYSRMFGVEIEAVNAAAPIDATLMALGNAWWMILIGLMLVNVAAEFMRPDPAGWVARSRAKRAQGDA